MDPTMSIGTPVNHGDQGRKYKIAPLQHPSRSAAFNGLYLSRLPLSPPLILQLDCWDADGKPIIPYDELPFLVCHLSLQTPEGVDATMVQARDPPASSPGGRSRSGATSTSSRSPSGELVSMLYGTLVTTAAEMTDMEGASGIYFVFPDVSVRYVGRFRLKANVMRITGGQPLDTTYTEPFDIVDPAEYVAPPVSDLTKHFDSQGIIRFGLPRSEW